MRKKLVYAAILPVLSAIILINSASATLLFRIGEVDGNVNPIVGADEFAASNDYISSFTLDMSSIIFPWDPTLVQNNLYPGYLSNQRLGDIVSDGRPLTNATSSYNLLFNLPSNHTDLVFTYGRYGSETDHLVTSLYLDGNPQSITGPGENNYQVLDFDFGDVVAGDHLITINYIGGATNNGHYIDFYELNGNAAPVPEPATMLLLGTGLAGLAAFRKKFKK